MKLSIREHKVFYREEADGRFWPSSIKEEKFPPNDYWSIKCLKVTNNSIYLFLFSILNLILLLQVYRCHDVFLKGRTYIETKIVPQHEIQFPATTICPGTNGYKREVLQVGVKIYLTITQ